MNDDELRDKIGRLGQISVDRLEAVLKRDAAAREKQLLEDEERKILTSGGFGVGRNIPERFVKVGGDTFRVKYVDAGVGPPCKDTVSVEIVAVEFLGPWQGEG